jgi:hypothetical protein
MLKTAKPTETKRESLFERGYRKAKEGMFVATELASREGFLGFIGRATYLTIWATLLIIICTIWLLTLGGKLIKQEEQTTRSQND